MKSRPIHASAPCGAPAIGREIGRPIHASAPCGAPAIGRRTLLATTLAAPFLGAGAARAQERAVNILVPFSPGTSIDTLARLAAEHLRRSRGLAAAVENRVGGSGVIATQAVARGPHDGSMLLVTTNTFVTTPSLLPSLPYDPISDFAPVIHLASVGMALCVHADMPSRDVAGFVAALREKPGAVAYGSPGVGSPQHLGMALFLQRTGTQALHVPYRGSAGALPDLSAGRVAAMFVPVNAAVPLAAEGRVRLLAVAQPRRSAQAPAVPTMAEAGFAGLEIEVWFGLLGPAGMPAAQVQRLNLELNAMLEEPAVRQVLARQELEPKGGPVEAFAGLVNGERARWARVIREAGITAE